MQISASAIEALTEIVGPAHIKVGADTLPYCQEPTQKLGYLHPDRVVVVSPANTVEVSAVLALLHRLRIPCVTRSGGTGLVGGNVPRDDVLVVLSLARLTGVEDNGDGTITFGAGMRLGDIHEYVDLRFPDMEFGTKIPELNACIGGLVATNAGGDQFVLYGSTADQVIDLEYVLADGAIVPIRHLAKANDGLHLQRLLPGSEGILAVITAIRVRLHRRLPRRAVVALALPTINSAGVIAKWLRGHDFGPGVRLRSVEFMDSTSLYLAYEYIDKRSPFGAYDFAAWLLVELAGVSDLTDAATDLVGTLIADGQIDEDMTNDSRAIQIASDTVRCDELWEPRINLPSALNRYGPLKFDVSLPSAEAFWQFAIGVNLSVTEVSSRATFYMFGHIADGTVHLNILGAQAHEWGAITGAVLELVAGLGGSISSEHGVGTKLMPYTTLVRSIAELWTMLRVKWAFDPHNILNPGAVVPRSQDEAERLWGRT